MLCLPSHNPNNGRLEILTESLPTTPLPLHPLHIHGQCTHTMCLTSTCGSGRKHPINPCIYSATSGQHPLCHCQSSYREPFPEASHIIPIVSPCLFTNILMLHLLKLYPPEADPRQGFGHKNLFVRGSRKHLKSGRGT